MPPPYLRQLFYFFLATSAVLFAAKYYGPRYYEPASKTVREIITPSKPSTSRPTSPPATPRPRASAPTTAPPSRILLGRWQGTVRESAGDTYTARVTMNAREGSIDYSINCGGSLRLLNAGDDPDSFVYRQTITYGNCAHGCTIFLRRRGSSLDFREQCAEGSSTGTLSPR